MANMMASRPPLVGVLYGGAHRFSKGTPAKLGRLARAAFEQWAPDAVRLAHAVGLDGAGAFPRDDEMISTLLRSVGDSGGVASRMPTLQFAIDIHARLMAKLDADPIEDLRIDFEDGLGPIRLEAETALATRVGDDVAACVASGEAPRSLGIRPKAVSAHAPEAPAPHRCASTLEAFLTAYRDGLARRNAEPHPHFVVTLPKVENAEEVGVALEILQTLESSLGLPPIALEVMIESAGGLWSDQSGALRIPALVRAGKGRVVGVHFGTYDYSASVGIPAPYQKADHPACELARQLLVSACAPLNIVVSDGATHEMPIGPHRAKDGVDLSADAIAENRLVVEGALRLHAANINRALRHGMPIGWDLHPTQLIARYAAAYAFYRRPLPEMTRRMRAYCDREAKAALTGSMFDDAASAAGVRLFFERGYLCGALSADDMAAAGLDAPTVGTPASAGLQR